MLKKWISMMVLLTALLSGCTQINREDAGIPRVVTRIEASFDSDTLMLRRTYSDSEKLRGVLTYLRCLTVYGKPEPEVVIPQTNRGKITISFSDGTTKTYEQQGDEFLRQDNGPWYYINQEQAQEFPLLLKLMESDEIS